MSIEHATFVVERSYALSPGRVFAAWADPGLKARWFCEPGGHYERGMRSLLGRLGDLLPRPRKAESR